MAQITMDETARETHKNRWTLRLLWTGLIIGLLLFSNSYLAAQTTSSPDGIWRTIGASKLTALKEADSTLEYWINPDKFRAVSLDKTALSGTLDRAPQEIQAKTAESGQQPALIYLPTPDGTYMAFEIVQTYVMAPELAAQFPEIKTYKGISVEDSSITARLDYTPAGFHAQVLSPGNRWYIDPHLKDNDMVYASYYKKDYNPPNKTVRCELEANETLERLTGFVNRTGDELTEFELAVATTGEYSVYHGGTPSGTLAAVVTTINRVTGIYEKEVAVRLTLIGNNNEIIFTDPNADPFFGNDNAGILIGESQSVINGTIGAANYEIGHTFSTGAGGLAGLGVVCVDSAKAYGVTGSPDPIGDPYDVDYVAHEIGHQFNANHTFNGSDGSCSGGNRNGDTAYEPGSGSTILAYAGICWSDDLQANSDAIFHSESYTEITTFVNGATCGNTISLGNAIPTVNAGNNYTIPVQTPFVLTGSGNDANSGDTLTYLWEERDLGPQAFLDASDDGQIPLFRVYTPTSEPVRYLPRLATLAANTTNDAEKIPQVARTMDWRLTVRDNQGGVDSDDTQITVSAAAGPFQVTSPNGGEDLGGTVNIIWNVANTNNSPVNAATVDIFLSTDGGLTFDTVTPLASGTPNDGVQAVILPEISTNIARIMVKAADNIFFDISNQNFSIEPSADKPSLTDPPPGITLSGSSQTFIWDANETAVIEWRLTVGSSLGASDIHDSGSLGSALTTTVNDLPIDGRALYVRLWYRTAAAGWSSVDAQYTASSAGIPSITSPTPGSTLAGGSETFTWDPNEATVVEWWLHVGNSLGASDIHDSGSLGSALSTTVNNLPIDGRTVFVRLWYLKATGGWLSVDAQYTASSAGIPSITSPTPGSTLTSSTETFTWDPSAATVLEWWVYVGRTQGGSDLYDSGSLGTNLSATINGLPTDGGVFHLRLWYRTAAGGWQWIDAQYVAHTGTSADAPAITSHAPGSTLSGSSETFTWDPNTTIVTEWWIYVGRNQGGMDLHDSGSLGTALTTTINDLPIDGSTLHLRLWYRNATGSWQYVDSQYIAHTGSNPNTPTVTSPTPGSTLTGDSETFTWTANTTPVLNWWIYLGRSQGTRDIYDSGPLGNDLSALINGLPTNGSTIYMRLWYYTATGGWSWVDTNFVAHTGSGSGLPILTSPTPGSTLGRTQTFRWSANGSSVLEWWLYLGRAPGGNDIHDSGSLGTSLSAAVGSLPMNGGPVFLRLWHRTAAEGWRSIEAQFTAEDSDFDATVNQYIDNHTHGKCTGEVIAVITLNSGSNSLTVDTSFNNGDLDMNVTEPDGTCVYYNAASSANGGAHSGDVTTGGVESYTISNGPAGAYTVRAHHHNGARNSVNHIFGFNGSVSLEARAERRSFDPDNFKEDK